MSVLEEIVARRAERLRAEGPAMGCALPRTRELPLVPFGRSDGAESGGRFLICEIKRRSPSKGAISPALDAPAQASLYASRGVKTVSVLTERDHFSGSLSDLVEVKRRNPGLCVLRKDFLLEPEDIDASYRAGADAVLLIAAALSQEKLAALHERASRLGLASLVEIHAAGEAAKVAPLAPAFVGLNARDLDTFVVDLASPLAARSAISWKAATVFESGISSEEHAAFAAASGFDGILVGESVVRSPELIPALLSGLRAERRPFWDRLYAGRLSSARPLVKVCGLTRAEDARLADELGADLLGFIFAPSKRRADAEAVRSLGATRAQKVGVVVTSGGPESLPEEVERLLDGGALDAVQLHGDEGPEDCWRTAFPYYKALRLQGAADVERIPDYRCPRVLLDAYREGMRGGTGERIGPELLRSARSRGPLWVAGGIGAENVRELILAFNPELVDASSGLEASPGRKDAAKLRAFFGEIEAASRAGARG